MRDVSVGAGGWEWETRIEGTGAALGRRREWGVGLSITGVEALEGEVG